MSDQLQEIIARQAALFFDLGKRSEQARIIRILKSNFDETLEQTIERIEKEDGRETREANK